jgi:hypothetical protein
LKAGLRRLQKNIGENRERDPAGDDVLNALEAVEECLLGDR